MYLKSINGKQLLVLNVNIRSFKTFYLTFSFSHNLDLRENVSFVSARKLFLRKFMNCLTGRKLKARK